jgi:hypothetical protein
LVDWNRLLTTSSGVSAMAFHLKTYLRTVVRTRA